MEIPDSFDIVNRLAERDAAQARAPNELGRETFLELLVAQLSNQDPLSPLQDHEFVAQLATFSSLEQLEGINANMQASLLMDQSVNNSLATTLIGKEVLAQGNTVHLGPSGDETVLLELSAPATVSVVIRDAAGQPVRHLDEGQLGAGQHKIQWDGTNDAGVRMDEADYTVEVTAVDEAGTAVSNELKVRARVTGVRFVEGTGFLMLGDLTLPLASVIEVLDPNAG